MAKSSRTAVLVNLITKAKQAYYFSGEEIMSDAEYDALEDELAALAPGHPLLQTVGAPVSESGKHLTKVTHRMMMGSQSKVNSLAEFDVWQSRRNNREELHCSLKADGCSIAAYYNKGKLEQVVTRGDGATGEDVTANAYSFQGLPVMLEAKVDCSVRLEAVLTIPDWLRLDPEKTSNPRSLANGVLGRKDGKNANFLTALAFDVEGIPARTEQEKSEWLEKTGFTTTKWCMASNVDEVASFIASSQSARDQGKLNYWADGAVIKLNNLDTQKALGVSSGRPKGQVAWKFSTESAQAKLLDVDWSVGHTGAVTPIARVSPVRLGGTTVQRISLSNPEFIEALGIRIGSQVEVVKAGDIIPKITRVLRPGQGSHIQIPRQCPECEAKLEKMLNVDGSSSTVVYCRNNECEAQTAGRIKRWTKSRNVLGLGDSVIEALCASGKVQSVPDLFALKGSEIKDLIINPEKKIRLGLRRASSICREIAEKGTQMSLAEFLGSFGTRKLGVRRSELMIAANPELQKIEKWFDGSLANEEFAARAGVPKSGVQILEGLKDRETIIRQALKHVKISQDKPAPEKDLPTICITGSLPSGKKKHEWETPLRQAGYQLVDDVTKNLHALVVSNPDVESSKSKKARKLGVHIISEAELAKLCKEKGQ